MIKASPHERAKSDLKRTVTEAHIWSELAYSDIRSKYRLSTLGSLWITLTTGSLAVGIGVFYGQFFGVDMKSYLPYFATSYVFWIFLSSIINEAATTLIGSSNLIKSSQMPIVFHILRMVQRHMIIAAHNMLVVIGVWLFFRWPLGLETLLAIPGLIIAFLFITGVAIVLGVVCVRYRDIPPLIQALTSFLFFATPVIWHPEQLQYGQAVLDFNPIAYMLVIIRDPLLDRPMDVQTWLISIALAIVSLLAGAVMYIRYRRRIAYWV